jgi:hypothetical protein
VPGVSNDTPGSGENARMLLPVSNGAERAETLAAKLGCTVVCCREPQGQTKPALLGSVGTFASTLEEFGGRWDPDDKVHVFASWPMLEAALQHVIAQRERAQLG